MIHYLQDVPGLESLERIATTNGVVITARGGFARRVYTHELLTPPGAFLDLFDLTPFTSGISLSHSGPPEQNAVLLEAIRRLVPMAECFRWDLRSRDQDDVFERAKGMKSLVPVNSVRLSTHSGFDDPYGAQRDIDSGRYRFVRNPGFIESPLYRRGEDLEVFSAISYLRALFEREDDAVTFEQPGFDAVRSVFEEAQSWQNLGRLQENASLRMRLHYSLKALGASICTTWAQEVVDAVRLRDFVAFVDGPARDTSTVNYTSSFPMFSETHADATLGGKVPRGTFGQDLDLDNVFAITASERISGDLCRLPPLVPFGSTIGADTEFDVLKSVAGRESRLAEGVEAVRTSAWVQVLPGPTPLLCEAGFRNEMLHFAIVDKGGPPPAKPPLPDEDVSILMIFAGMDGDSPTIVAPMAMCSSRPYRVGALWDRVQRIRVACGSLLDRLPVAQGGAPIRVAFATIARRVSESPPEAQPAWTVNPRVFGDATMTVNRQ